MSENTTIDALQAQADSAAFGARLGIDLTSVFTAETEHHAFSFEGEANKRLAQEGTGILNGIKNAREGTYGGGTYDNDSQKQRFSRALSDVEITNNIINNLIAEIDVGIASITSQINSIEEQLAQTALRREEILRERLETEQSHAELLEDREELEDTIDGAQLDSEAAELAHQQAMMAMIRADNPDAIVAAEQRVDLTREEAEAAAHRLLEQRVELEELDTEISRLDSIIQRLDANLSTLSEEELTLLEEHSDLVSDREQLIVMRDRLDDPEFRAAVERGEITREDVLERMPEELQTSVFENIVDRFQNTVGYATDAISSVGNSIKNFFTRAHDGEVEQLAPETPELATAAPQTPAPALTHG